MAQSNFTTLNDLVFPFRNYVLVLPGWYPTWIDPNPGDFNQRQVLAASVHLPQIVLYVAKDVSGTLNKTEVRYNQLSKYVIEILVLYPRGRVQMLDAVQSNLQFFRLLMRYAAFIKERWGKPKLLHSYIVLRGGLAGYMLGKRWNLPFVLTEHWTIYCPDDPGYLLKRNRFFKWSVRRVFGSMAKFLPVTAHLNQQAAKLVKPVPFTVIPNVVETETFNLKEKPAGKGFKFVHVSTMTHQKNPHGLLRTFKAVNQQYPNTTLLMVGPYEPELKTYAAGLGLNENIVRFTGNVPYKKVAELIQPADALLMFSRYENLPCVILEALCCGLPVISSNVGGISEVINDQNGILVEKDNEVQLLRACCNMIENYNDYDRVAISAAAIQKFSYEAVAEQMKNVYLELVSIE